MFSKRFLMGLILSKGFLCFKNGRAYIWKGLNHLTIKILGAHKNTVR